MLLSYGRRCVLGVQIVTISALRHTTMAPAWWRGLALNCPLGRDAPHDHVPDRAWLRPSAKPAAAHTSPSRFTRPVSQGRPRAARAQAELKLPVVNRRAAPRRAQAKRSWGYCVQIWMCSQ